MALLVQKKALEALRLLRPLGYVGLSETLPVDSILDEVCAMTWRLSGR